MCHLEEGGGGEKRTESTMSSERLCKVYSLVRCIPCIISKANRVFVLGVINGD